MPYGLGFETNDPVVGHTPLGWAVYVRRGHCCAGGHFGDRAR